MKYAKVAERSPGYHEPSGVAKELDMKAIEDALGIVGVGRERCTQIRFQFVMVDVKLVFTLMR